MRSIIFIETIEEADFVVKVSLKQLFCLSVIM